MFKVIYDNKVVDLIHDVIYLRFLPGVNKFVATDSLSAHGFYGSDNMTVYQLEGRDCPLIDREVVLAKLVSITSEEFAELQAKLAQHSSVACSRVELARKIREKISELSEACHTEIVSGITVRLSDGKSHKFELTIEDQINLMTIQQSIRNGARKVLYHSSGNIVRQFDANDMQKVLTAASKHKTYHTTYFNILKHYVESCVSCEAVDAIKYGVKLSELTLPPELHRLAKENNIG